MDPTTDPTDANSTDESPEVDEAMKNRFNQDAVLMLPLSTGNVAVYTRNSQFHTIINEPDNLDQLRQLGQELRTRMFQDSKHASAARFYGEPDDARYARDLKEHYKNQRKSAQPTRKPKVQPMSVEVVI